MKVCEHKEFPGGMGGSHPRIRVVELDHMPEEEEGMTRFRAASKTPVSDWTPVIGADTVQPYSAADEETAAAVNSGAVPPA
jgi:hypothetical protein